NVAGGIVLLEAARQANVGRIVFSSTAAVYGVPDATPIPEDAPLRPINPYGETKRTFEGALGFYGEAYGLRSVSLRYFNVAGATAPDDPRTDAALVCNLGIGAGFSVREVVDAATAVVGRSIPETMGPRRTGDPPVLVAAADRAREVLGWTAARPTLDEMIGS